MPLPVNITSSSGTVTYVTLSAVNTTGKPGNLTVLQVRTCRVLLITCLQVELAALCQPAPSFTADNADACARHHAHLCLVCADTLKSCCAIEGTTAGDQ